MLKTRLARHGVWVLCLCSIVTAYANSNALPVTKTVLNASLSRTVMQNDFDSALLAEQLGAAQSVAELASGALLAIAGTGAPVARVLDVEYGDYVDASLSLTDLPQTEQDLVTVGQPAIVHGVRVVTASVSPVLATAQGLRMVRRVEYEVATLGGVSINEAPNPRPIHWAFAPVLRTMVDNLDELHPEVALDAPARFLVMGSTRVLNTDLAGQGRFQDWLDLKRRKGYDVQFATLSDIFQVSGDSTWSGIRNFVSTTYHDQTRAPLVYAVIIGDYTQVPTDQTFPTLSMDNPETSEPSVGDNAMFAVDGSDYIPDVFAGRISAGSVSEYAMYFRKAVDYELNSPLEDTQWLRSVTCTAGNYSDAGTFPVTPVWNMNWAREYIMNSGCITDADTFYYHDNSEDASEWTEEIVQDINEGVSAVWYRGWASSQAWLKPVLTTQDIQNINTGGKYHTVWGIVCGSGNFAFPSGPCLGEEWTTGLGTPSQPRGAITYVGASDLHTNTRHNNAMLAAMVENISHYGIRSTGALTLAGKLEVLRQYPLESDSAGLVHFYGFHVFNILGDPEVPLLFCEPKEFNVVAPSTLTQGETFVNVTVTDATTGEPVPQAIVAVRRVAPAGTSAWTRLTNELGQASVPVNLTGSLEAQITVWKHEYVIHRETMAVAQAPRDPYIESAEYEAGDDDMPNPGETFQVRLNIYNTGTEAATWSLTATSADEQSSVISGSATTPEIAPGSSSLSSPLTVRAADNLWNGAHPALNITFDDGQSTMTRQFRFGVAAPDPQIVEFVVQDADGFISPGETANIAVRLTNGTTIPAAALSATVHSFSNAISFSDAELDWSNVVHGQETLSNSTITATIPGGVTRGTQIALRFVFSWNGVPFTFKQVFLTAGEVTPDVPTGPDAYGYYAYENTDNGFAATPSYSWTELDPDFGGSGATAYLVRDDTHTGLALPQPFTFYGQSYDSIFICSNGWLSFGRATLPEFRNWEIPSPIGPPAMVCPFWDDLIANTDSIWPNDNAQHEIYTRQIGQTFIVQWRALNRAGLSQGIPNRDFCTFQVVLEYPAGQGDGSILFLYNQIANTDVSNNYATVGIQDDLHVRGLGLTFANTDLPSVSPLAAGRAIRFTTTPPDAFLSADDPAPLVPEQFALYPAYPNPFNPSTELRFDLTQAGQTTLKVYDVLGREVATLMDQQLTAGTHVAQFDASTLGSGLYFARLVSGSNSAVQKLVLMK